jgi:methylmalonyl-CoA/ethylmalonyl-CoA epimerase
MVNGLDHIAIVVDDTEKALEFWRDRFGLTVLLQEVVNDGAVLLTHLDLGNTQLQLVQPLVPVSPLVKWLAENGSGLHHFCFKVDDTAQALEDAVGRGFASAETKMHQGTQGKRAVFLDKSVTGVQIEFTGP